MFILENTSILLQAPRNVFTAVGLPLVVGLLSGSPTRKVAKGQWYNSLIFPPGRADARVFPIAWTTLYCSMGYASYIAVQAYDTSFTGKTLSDLSTGIALYYAQLALNVAWTPLFFVKKRTQLALIDSTLLTATVMWMTKVLHKPTNGKTTWFLLPYCAWLSYATYINAGIVYLNRGRNVPKMD